MKTGVRFLLGGSQFFLAVMEEAAARKLIDDFYHRRLGESVKDDSGAWSIRTLSIHAIHLEDLAALYEQQKKLKDTQPTWPGAVTKSEFQQMQNWPRSG